MKQKKLPFIYRIIRGAIGKRYVIKHYRYGVIMTKYPNMKNIIPSEAQKMRRRLFRKAVKYAQDVYANPVLKEEKRKILRRPTRLFQALIKEWFRKKAEQAFWNNRRITLWKNNVANNSGNQFMTSVISKQSNLIPLAQTAIVLKE